MIKAFAANWFPNLPNSMIQLLLADIEGVFKNSSADFTCSIGILLLHKVFSSRICFLIYSKRMLLHVSYFSEVKEAWLLERISNPILLTILLSNSMNSIISANMATASILKDSVSIVG